MELLKNSVAILSPSQTSERPVSSSEAIRQFVVKAGEVYGKQITAPLVAIWIEHLSEHSPEVLQPLFRKALSTCKFFPTIAEFVGPLQAVKQAALPEEAGDAWQKVLAIRREHFNPDFPRYLTFAISRLPERVQRAARASGIFQEVSGLDQLHVWCKKRFIESYLAWEEIEENRFLLPDGELKNALLGLANTKALPSSEIPFNNLHERGLKYAEELKKTGPSPCVSQAAPVHETPRVIDFQGRAAELQRQAELIRQKYLKTGNEGAL